MMISASHIPVIFHCFQRREQWKVTGECDACYRPKSLPLLFGSRHYLAAMCKQFDTLQSMCSVLVSEIFKRFCMF